MPMMRMSNCLMFVPSLSSKVIYKTGNSVARPFFPNSTRSNNILSMSLRAWTCHGSSQRDMVEKLSLAGIIKSTAVRKALLLVDRANYVENPSNGYVDAPQATGYGQTISAPHMHSHALEEIVPELISLSQKDGINELKVLDVGCGSGYLTAAFGRLFDSGEEKNDIECEDEALPSPCPIHTTLSKGRVWGIEVVPELVKLSRQNIQKADGDLLDTGTVTIARGNGWDGLPEEGPYHAIHVGAAAEIFPKSLMMQLYPDGGVMVIPVGADKSLQNLYKVVRVRENEEFKEEDFEIEHLFAVRYVPLINPSK